MIDFNHRTGACGKSSQAPSDWAHNVYGNLSVLQQTQKHYSSAHTGTRAHANTSKWPALLYC